MNNTTGIPHHTIARIWQTHTLGPVHSVTPLTGGVANWAVRVNGDFVLRLDRMPEDRISARRYQSEATAADLMRPLGVPVLDFIAADITGENGFGCYSISAFIPGRRVVDAWPDLTPRQRSQLAYSAGEYLAAMHGCKLDGFGWLGDYDTNGFATWADFSADCFTRFLALGMKQDSFTADEAARLERCLAAHRPLLDACTEPVLLHGDYHFENMLCEGERITAVLDFDWAVSGDPAWDFKMDAEWERGCPGSAPDLMRGYRAHRQLDSDYAVRARFYKLIMVLDDTGWIDRIEQPQSHANAVRRSLELLAACENDGLGQP
jgi:aminoglycoside phosphotransferase (APT) family kinase protein